MHLLHIQKYKRLHYSIIFLAIISLLLLLYKSNSIGQLPKSIYVDDQFPYAEGLLHSGQNSAFTLITSEMNKTQSKNKPSLSEKLTDFFDRDSKVLKNWDYSSRKEKCKWLIRGIYADSNWTNIDILEWTNDVADKNKFQVSSERVRIYNYCFMNGNIDPVEVFDELNIPFADPYDFQSRMFMFLKKVNRNDKAYMYPLIKNVRNGDIIAKPRTKMSAKEYNANFMGHWKAEARGRGITLTVAPDDIKLLRSLFKVLEKLGNEYPVEVVHKGGEMTPKMEDLIRQYAEETNQEVYLIDLSPILDSDFAEESIKSFGNKWLAAMFNTFEEVMLLDADVVIYNTPDHFFELKGYKDTGLMLWKDREIIDNEIYDKCTAMAPFFEPSLEEHELLGTTQKYRLTGPSLETHNEPEATTLIDYFRKKRLTIIDSGLVIFNKKQKLHALVLSNYYHINRKFLGCVYGDKEFFEFGALAAGEDYHIAPQKAAALGPLGFHSGRQKYYVCSTQMGHPDENNNILWSNGGLMNCKSNCAEADIKRHPEYFKAKYGNLDTLKVYYTYRVEIQGFITPDVNKQEWFQYPDCAHFMFCAFLEETSDPLSGGKLVKFTEKEVERYNDIGKAWYHGTK